ncbi:MAG TPA: hypothetical protein VFG47_20070 [Geminicoccaceae bacterium]|nr:hypothetical protein [Geminicoccaceae bacterium]
MPRTAVCLLLLAPIFLWSCVTTIDGPIPMVQPDPATYEPLYPHYVELCSVSQYRPLDGDTGGIPGHAVLYLKGACRSEDAPRPAIEMCEPGSDDPGDPRHGVGISVNRLFANVNWVAIPGKRLFLDGATAPGGRVTRRAYDATLGAALDLGLFRGIEVRPEDLRRKPGDQSPEEFLARDGLGTDFALRFARTAFCARVPVTRPMMEEVAAHLNRLNGAYGSGATGYTWSGYCDNCSHPLRNALAAAGIWRPVGRWEISLGRLFQAPLPANELFDLAERAVAFPIDDLDRVRSDPNARRTLLRHEWLPTGHGSLLTSYPVHGGNDLYETRYRILALEGPLAPRHHEVLSLLRERRNTDVVANLRYFESWYRAILAGRPRRLPGHPGDFTSRYYRYIERQLAEVERKLARLGATGTG